MYYRNVGRCSQCGTQSWLDDHGICRPCGKINRHNASVRRSAELKQERATVTLGLNQLQSYVWEHKDNMTIGAICKHMGCKPAEVRGALEAGLIALHRPRQYTVRGTWHL